MNKQSQPTDSIIYPRGIHAPRITIVLAVSLILIQGCANQASFDSAGQAIDSLVTASRAQDIAQLKAVLGPDSDEVISSGDEVADKNSREHFVKAYDERHELVAGKDGSMTLVVGNNDWPLPIPIIQSGGKWLFDTKAAKEEILNRRIGRNELDAIQTCLAILDAQRDYASFDRNANGLHDYAAKFISDPGTKNGLFWPTAENEPPSPLGPLVAVAASKGYKREDAAGDTPQPYHGYLFRILTAQGPSAPGGAMDYMVGGKLIGGFAIVAWPAEYGNSGIMTFIMSHEGIVYQRNLGTDTANTAGSMTAYDPGPEWKKEEPNK
jgi:hypothetical protein